MRIEPRPLDSVNSADKRNGEEGKADKAGFFVEAKHGRHEANFCSSTTPLAIAGNTGASEVDARRTGS